MLLGGYGSSPFQGTMDSINNSALPINGRASSHTGAADAPENTALSHILKGVAAFPDVLELLQAQGRQIEALREEVKALRIPRQDASTDGWLDAEGARKYLSMSANTFDKYRYQTNPSIKGYKVGGKTLFKRGDLDNFVRLFEIKSTGLS